LYVFLFNLYTFIFFILYFTDKHLLINRNGEIEEPDNIILVQEQISSDRKTEIRNNSYIRSIDLEEGYQDKISSTGKTGHPYAKL
jgi:hypothetical protein